MGCALRIVSFRFVRLCIDSYAGHEESIASVG